MDAVLGSSERSAVRRALSGAFVALCVVAQLVTSTHMVLVRHALCSLDGEAVDAPRSARPPTPCAHARDVDSFGNAHDEPAVDAHNHCELALDRSSRLGLAPAVAVVIGVALFGEGAPELESTELPSGAGVLYFAPKTSPPA